MSTTGDFAAPRTPLCVWPPTQWPPIEPEPGVDDLGEPVDWMTYSHAALYQMATEGVAAEAALEVADEWSRLGEALDEIGTELRKAMTRCEEGWSGEAAELARETGRGLGDWSRETGKRAMNACVCVQQQAENARVAAQKMRELPPPAEPRVMPASEQQRTGAMCAMSASPFTGGGFEGARDDRRAVAGPRGVAAAASASRRRDAGVPAWLRRGVSGGAQVRAARGRPDRHRGRGAGP